MELTKNEFILIQAYREMEMNPDIILSQLIIHNDDYLRKVRMCFIFGDKDNIKIEKVIEKRKKTLKIAKEHLAKMD